MEASSITRHRVLARAKVSNWAWLQLPGVLRLYVAAVPLATLAGIALTASHTTWHLDDLLKFLLLLTCGLISVIATPRVAYLQSGSIKDFITAWVLPVAVLLPPVYAMMIPVPLFALTQWRAHQGILYRRVFSAAAIGLSYGAGALVFRALPGSFAGGAIGLGTHALTWAVAVVVCEFVGGTGHRALILGGIKLSDPSVPLLRAEFNREALLGAFAEFDLGVLITVAIAVNALLAAFAVPTVLLARRFMMHVPLVEQSRVDTKTGLLNAAAWEKEAAVEVDRAVRTNAPLAVAMVDIDHFKRVNDTYGHIVGDRVLRAVSDSLRGQLRNYDLAGRFGGEEFILLLPQAREMDAWRVAERLRTHVATMEIPVDDELDCAIFVRLTISVGVAALDGVSRTLTDLMAAADGALYHAKETGRNKTHMITANAQSALPLPRPPTPDS
jgi:diguanylate cyclase (GGDEF)-like protein